MKRILVFILMIGLFLSSFNFEVFASGINSEQEFFNYLDGIGQRRQTEEGNVANYLTYKKYNLIVYGSPWGDTKPTGIGGYTGTQYRYLGYTLEDEAYTNPYFPPDETSGNKPEQFNYIKVANARESWRVITDEAQREHMLNSPMSGNGATSLSFTLNSIGGIEYGKLLSASTWKSQGSVYLQHRGTSGRIWYITETFPPMVGNTIVTGKISTPENTYYIKKGETEVKIPVTVTAEAVKSGRANDKHISNISASFQGNSNSQKGKSNVTVNSNFIATRANYTVGTHQIKLEGTVSLSTIFNDYDSSNVSKTITLIVEPEGEDPYVTTVVTPEPKEKKFEGQDIDVTLTINGDLKNYTKTSNIKEWVFYARQKEDTKALEKKVYTKTLNASTTYKFKIPASKVTKDYFTQGYVVRARVYFNQKVNGKDYYDAPAETFVKIYKNDPPPIIIPPPIPNNESPVAVITAKGTVKAGEILEISGINSYDPDGQVIDWLWDIPEANTEEFYIATGKYWYPINALGENLVYLTVTDDGGSQDSTTETINVIEPYPEAKLKITGNLKENRKFTISTMDSKSPEKYPLSNSKTKVTIKPLSGGGINDIKYFGSSNLIEGGIELIGVTEKDILIKKEGVYSITLYVENVIGYSDTIERIIEIAPDLPPVAEFTTSTKVYRDPYDSNKAIIETKDMSYSPDGDIIQKRIWKYRYDSNNNGSFEDESWITYSNTNELQPSFKTNQVGRYQIRLEIVEDFGQPTILDFIVPSDYRRGDTSNKHRLESIVTVENRPPFADFEP